MTRTTSGWRTAESWLLAALLMTSCGKNDSTEGASNTEGASSSTEPSSSSTGAEEPSNSAASGTLPSSQTGVGTGATAPTQSATSTEPTSSQPSQSATPTVTASQGDTETGGAPPIDTGMDAAGTGGIGPLPSASNTSESDAGGSEPLGAGCTQFGQPLTAGNFDNADLNGPSGLVASRAYPGVLYAQLDTGGPAQVYVSSVSGADLGDYTLDGLEQTDWEDLAIGPGPDGTPFIYVADIGDNAAGGMGGGDARQEIQVFRFPEPEASADQAATHETVSYQTLRFTYPDEAQNAESLFVDPVSGDLFILTKTADEALLYRAASDTAVDTPTVLEEVGRVSVGASTPAAADISPSGDRILVRTYEALLLWPRAEGQSVAEALAAESIALPAADEPRSEGVTFSADGTAWYSSGEEDNAIYSGAATCP